MTKILVILGQTATGKSDLAVKLAKKINGEIISADSRQVYKGLDIGSGKVTKKEMDGIPHHLLDVASPKRKFSVAQYQKLTEKKIKKIISRKHVPIICGGTGFYIDSITNGTIFPEVPPNQKLRKQLNKKSTEELFKILKKLDSKRTENIESKNKVRLIRAIEITKTLGKVPPFKKKPSPYTFIKIGLYLPPEKLKEKIEKRLLKRIKAGMVKEVKDLHANGLSWKRLEELGLEYRYVALYLQGKLTKKEMVEKLKTEIFRFAKRQMRWFKRDKEIEWIEAQNPKLKSGIYTVNQSNQKKQKQYAN